MNNPKVVFTDSGLGGLSIMAEFVELAKTHNLAVDATFFNAQYSRDLGYKKMTSNKQVEIFDRVLNSIQKKYQPDIIAIACNTLSVVYYQTEFYKNKTTPQVVDIIKVGKDLIKNTASNTIIEVAMPTTIESEIYRNPSKKRVAISSDVMLPDAIENGYKHQITEILNTIFTQAQKLSKTNTDVSLFLGCTHFPIIKTQFIKVAEQKGISIQKVLNPNKAFSQLVFDQLTEKKQEKNSQTISVEVITRIPFQKTEVLNMANLVKRQSEETADALQNYRLQKDLF